LGRGRSLRRGRRCLLAFSRLLSSCLLRRNLRSRRPGHKIRSLEFPMAREVRGKYGQFERRCRWRVCKLLSRYIYEAKRNRGRILPSRNI
jgi:hypothetical protein